MTDYVHFNPEFDDLPLIQVAALKLDDSDIAFQSDLSYMRLLLMEIHLQAVYGGPAKAFPEVLTDELDWVLAETAGIKDTISDLEREFRWSDV